MLEETRPDHAISSAVTTAMMRHSEDKEQQKGEMRFNNSTFECLTFWLS